MVDEHVPVRWSRVTTAFILATVAPLLLLFLASAWIVLGWAVGASPFWPDPQMTLSEAAGVGNAGEVVRLITVEHRDPNRNWPVRAGILGPARIVTPLQAAGKIELIPLLLRHGAVPDSGSLRTTLICQAVAAGAPDIVEMLLKTGDASDPRTICLQPPN